MATEVIRVLAYTHAHAHTPRRFGFQGKVNQQCIRKQLIDTAAPHVQDEPAEGENMYRYIILQSKKCERE